MARGRRSGHEPRDGRGGGKEGRGTYLRRVCVRAAIGHGEQAWTVVTETEVLICVGGARAEKEGWDVVGKYVTSAFVGVEPRYMGISPAVAIPKALAQTGLSKEDIDVWEVCIDNPQL